MWRRNGPIGNDVATFWSNLAGGVSGVTRITRFDPSDLEVQIAAEIKDFDPRDWIDFKQARRMSRFSQIAVAAARQAIDDAKLEIGDHNRDDVAVVVKTDLVTQKYSRHYERHRSGGHE